MHNHITSDRCAWPTVSKQTGYGTGFVKDRERMRAASPGSRIQTSPSQPSALGKAVPVSDFESFGSFSG